MSELESEKVIEQKESIKLHRSVKGVYSWEIKILSLDVELLEKVDKLMREKFNNGVVQNGVD